MFHPAGVRPPLSPVQASGCPQVGLTASPILAPTPDRTSHELPLSQASTALGPPNIGHPTGGARPTSSSSPPANRRSAGRSRRTSRIKIAIPEPPSGSHPHVSASRTRFASLAAAYVRRDGLAKPPESQTTQQARDVHRPMVDRVQPRDASPHILMSAKSIRM